MITEDFTNVDQATCETDKPVTSPDVQHQSDKFISNNNQSARCSVQSYTIESYPESMKSSPDASIKLASSDEKLPLNFRQQRNTRIRCIILFIVIPVLILTIIRIIFIKFSLFNPDYLSKGNGPSKPQGYSSLKQTSTISTIYDVGSGGISGDPPCSSHTVVNDPSRSVTAPGFGSTCDNGPLFNTSIGGRWIRFIGTGGTMIPVQAPGQQHCSAFLSGWFNGTLPTVRGTIVNATACFDGNAVYCLLLIPVSVIKCSSFYVYFLPSVAICNARYCTI